MPPPGLGEPWRLLDIADVGLKRTCNAKVPSRHWVDKAVARASPAPWPGCPDALTVVFELGGQRAGWGRSPWHVDAGWVEHQPALTITAVPADPPPQGQLPSVPNMLVMRWDGENGPEEACYTRLVELPYRLYWMRV